MTYFDGPLAALLFWGVYTFGALRINKIVEGWPNHIVFVLAGFLFIAVWLGALVFAVAFPVLIR